MTADPVADATSLDSAAVGRIFASREIEVDFASSALYAAAIGAERDVYLDDRLADFGMAPPTYITSLEWPLVSGPAFLAAIGLAPAELFPRLLHLFQDSTFAAPIKFGDRLKLEATLESMGNVRNGAVATVRITTTDARSRRLVAESWFGSFFRDLTVRSPRASRGPPDITERMTMAPMGDVMVIPRSAAHVYAECARLRNPIHTSMTFANDLGYPTVALHGTLLWAKIGELIIDRHLHRRPERLRRLAAQFKRPMFPDRVMHIGISDCDAVTDHACFRLTDEETGDLLSEGIAEFDPLTSVSSL